MALNSIPQIQCWISIVESGRSRSRRGYFKSIIRYPLLIHVQYFASTVQDGILLYPRVYEWTFMSNPWQMLVIVAVYFYSIYNFLPSYMAHRKPFSLKGFIALYNIFQIVSNLAIGYGLATSGWTTHYTLGCQMVDYSKDKMALRMASYMWCLFILKLIELMETVLFVLRKKQKQVSVFHVYHHSSTAIILWIFTKYIPGGMASFGFFINAFVHVLMYTYYLLSSFGVHMQRKLEGAKRMLTIIQMVQLGIILLHITQSLLPSCKYPRLLAYIFIPDLSINLYFFFDFYIKNYIKKKSI